MERQQIIDYIENNLRQGYSIDQIEQSLSSNLPPQEYKSIVDSYRQNQMNANTNLQNNSSMMNSDINQSQNNFQGASSSKQGSFKKTPYVWVIIVITSLFVLGGIFSIVSSINQITSPVEVEEGSLDLNQNSTALFITLALTIIGVIINILFIIFLAKMNTSALMWTNIAFGYDILSDITNIVVGILFPSLVGGLMAFFGTILFIIFVPITIAFWVTFYIHLKKVMKSS